MSIRRKIILLTVTEIIIVLLILTALASVSIQELGNDSSNRILYLLCENGQRNLDAHFNRVEQAVESVSDYAMSDLEQTDLSDLSAHLERVRNVFEMTAEHTEGILTYYYRIDPEVSSSEKGFWYVNLNDNQFKEHEVTDITQYDTSDQSALVWFTVPKATGKPIWQPPYNTDNLDAYVFSYNEPISRNGRFIGVIGIEIDYETIAEQVERINLFDNGYAFINDQQGKLIFHPRISMDVLTGDNPPRVPEGLIRDNNNVRYMYDGVEKQGVWLPLENGMRLNVTVPISEINLKWRQLINQIVVVSAILIILFVGITLRVVNHITSPLQDLTKAAHEVDAGNYDVELNYDKDDEVGVLTRTVRQLIAHLKVHISELNNLAYADALTGVHNKGAYDIYVRNLNSELKTPGRKPDPFGIVVFDCDYLKHINDQFGHDKGDLYLKQACQLICRTFRHSPVFRIGGDEFAVILKGEDFANRDSLMIRFLEDSSMISREAERPWNRVSVSAGLAVYDSSCDRSAEEVARRADQLMYENKSKMKVSSRS